MLNYSVIVPVYRAVEVLPRCLAALIDQSVPCADYEIIIVDDGSPDQTAEVADKILAGNNGCVYGRVIRATHGGPAHARNLGARAARGDILAFTDADCEPDHDWLEQLTAALRDKTVSGAKGVYRTRQTSLVARFVQQEYQDKYDRLANQATIDFVDTYSAAYRRSVFLASGGFDEAFTTASVEDQEFSFRLAAQGHRLVFAPRAVVFHHHDATLSEYMQRKFGIGCWKMLVLKRHPGKAVRDSHTPQTIKVQMGLLASALLTTGATLLEYDLVLAANISWLLLLVSMLPLLSKIAWRDPAVIAIAPLMIGARALSLGLGLLRGFQRFALRSRSPA
jgi:glycosyltransferase involved in cell wall biosynthesis